MRPYSSMGELSAHNGSVACSIQARATTLRIVSDPNEDVESSLIAT